MGYTKNAAVKKALGAVVPKINSIGAPLASLLKVVPAVTDLTELLIRIIIENIEY